MNNNHAVAVIWQGTPSPLMRFPRFASRLFLMLVSVYGVAISPSGAATAIGGAIFLLAAMDVLVVALRLMSTNIVITTHRISVATGVMNRQSYSLELFRVMDVTATQKWWERPMGIGTLTIDSSDRITPRIILAGVPRCMRVRLVVTQAAIDRRQAMNVREVNIGQV